MAAFQIWRFEQKLVDECANVLNEALRLIGCDLSPTVFLVGLNPRLGFASIVPDEHRIDANELEDCFAVLPPAVPFPDDTKMSDDEWNAEFQRHEQYLSECWRCIRSVAESQLHGPFYMVSVSPCCEINGRIVAIVAAYSKIDYEKYPRLDNSVFERFGRWPSLHFGVVEAVLNKFSEELRMKDAGRRHGFETGSPREVVRVAGAFFMRTHAWFRKGFSWMDIQQNGTLDFFEACNSISSMRYESRDSIGTIIVASPEHIALKTEIELERPVLVTDFRRVRKLLEMCRGELAVFTDSRHVWGIGTLVDDLHLTQTVDILTIQFLENSRWRLRYRKTDLMDVSYGEPRLPQDPASLGVVREKINSTFSMTSRDDVDTLLKLVSYAAKADHGTMIVFSERAAEESARLAKSNRGIKPFTPDESTIAAASSVDGAIMIDTAGICHGIGVILDGIACEHENPARGARFNSAVRYSNERQDCIIVVVSEDGMVDVVPYRDESRRNDTRLE